MSRTPAEKRKHSGQRSPQRDQRRIRKEISRTEKAIARLDREKNDVHARLMNSTVPEEAMQLQTSYEQIKAELEEAESRWFELQEELEA